MRLLILLTAVLSFFKYGESQTCSLNYVEAVRKCMQPFIAPNPGHIFLEGVFMAAINPTQLDTACRQRAEVDTCVKAVSGCNSVLEVPDWIGLNDSLNYICGEGRPAFEKFQKCTTEMKGLYETSFKLCELGLPMIENKNDPLENCRHSLGDFSCYVNASKLVCDSEEFMTNYCTKLHQPMKARQACKFDLHWNIKDLNMKCDVAAAADCMRNFTQGQYKVFTDGSIMTTPVSGAFLLEACKALSNSKICMNYTGRCLYHELADYWGIIESLDYLCNNKIAMDKYQGCTANGAYNFQQKFTNCQRGQPDITNINVGGQACRRQNYIYNCYVQAAKETCDSEIMITYYYKKLLQPTQNLKDCYLDNTRINASSYSQCDASKLMSCTSKIRTIDELIKNTDDQPISPNLLQEYCIVAYEAHKCVQDQAMCTDMDRISKIYWLDLRKTFNYNCFENKQGFLDDIKCLVDKKSKLEAITSNCLNQNRQMLEYDDAVGECRKRKNIQHCNALAFEFECHLGSVEEYYNYYSHKDRMKVNYSCELEKPSSRGNRQVICGKIFSLLTMAAIALLVFLH